VKISAGFRPETEVLRTSIYRDDVYLCMLPTDNPKSAFKRILWKALDEAPSRGGLVPKTIFFVSWITDAMVLKKDIGRWLRERGYPDRIVKSIHGDFGRKLHSFWCLAKKQMMDKMVTIRRRIRWTVLSVARHRIPSNSNREGACSFICFSRASVL
jgi:hypothetical protein